MRIALIAVALLAPLLCVRGVAAASYPPEPGTDRESAAYLAAAERFLESLDLNAPGLEFRRLGGTTATNWAVRQNGRTVADLKCTSGNTDHHGAVVVYRLGRHLGFKVYPVAVYRTVDLTIDGRRVTGQCALKEWSSVFTQYYWTRDTFADTSSADKRRLVQALTCDQPPPDEDDEFTYRARSAYGDPKIEGKRRVVYRGETTLLAAARDFSNMMVVDVLIGNEDRFPGGNTFFRSVTTQWERDGEGIGYADPRLFSLDNEAAFKGASPGATHSVKDLHAHLSRFDGEIIEGLRTLTGDAAALERITDGEERLSAFLRAGIGLVLEHYDAVVARCGQPAAVFPASR